MPRWLTRDRVAVLASIFLPAGVTLLMVPFRNDFANTDAALVLVLTVVAVAANGYRLAGILAALSAGASFDFLLTHPYEQFTITRTTDVETAVLLLLVGVGVSELAVHGRRQQALAARRAGYLAGIQAAADVMAAGGSIDRLIDAIATQLTRLLGLRGCSFQEGVAGMGDPPRLQRDGHVTWRHEVWDVDRDGLPCESETELLVENHGRLYGRFLLTATPHAHASLDERRAAVTLADQVGAALR